MKVEIKGSLAIKFGGAILGLLLAFPSHAQLMLAHEGHHSGGGGCKIETGDFPVTFSAYEVPEGNLPPMHSFCDHVPNTGKVNLTIELSDEARKLSLAVRLVKEGDHEGHGGGDAQSNTASENSSDEHDEHAGHDDSADEHGIVYMPAEVHKSGIIVVAANITELGQHAVLLETEDESGNVKTAVKIPLHVGGGGGHGSHGGGIGIMEIVLGLLVVVGAAFYFLRRKRAEETPSA